MSGLTKDQLKNELITHGVELPPAVAKKEEYVRLYEKYVAPVEQAKGDFSSDDEDSPVVAKEMVNMDQSLIIDGVDISKLGDDDLYQRLSDLGATVGPIVESTRKVYQKKLFGLMGGEVPNSPTFNGDVDEEEEYSDSEEAEEEKEKVEMVATRQVENTASPPPSDITDIRKRILLSSGMGIYFVKCILL
ncbi:lamina-associated polypeptide 2, isoforms beta/gamma-like [Palaemon carinicauda]|uniref:lamina-associated polypeptide 2, isoforms beta/gamma-like n=1 Tax=Palaemon carinicauda TaxID=392227 RepID=UPI0035B5EC93